MKYLQRLGKSLMLPVAVLPLCGILMGIGYALCPVAMQGGEIAGTAALIGEFLIKAGGAIIDNLPLLFAIGVGVGMSKDNDGVGGIAALVSFLIITNLLSAEYITSIIPSVKEDKQIMLAFQKIVNPFIGILTGIIGSVCYNSFKDVRLPSWLSFFSGKRCVAIIAGLISILAAAIMAFVWPLCFVGLIEFGQFIAGLGALGAGLYAFFNRLLIPIGMHHALNNVFWFDTVGLGDLSNFWSGKTSKDVGWSLGMYMSGFFPCMMFGIPGAALAIYHCAKRKAAVAGLLLSAAVCSFVCGVTEPFEFAFMFVAPWLYIIYALLYGVFTYITVLVGFRAGFSFSAGLTDLVFSASLPAAAKTWLIIPLGIAAFAVFYIVFRIIISRFSLKTPGNEEVEEEVQKNAVNKDDSAMAEALLTAVGGKANVVNSEYCFTRLRLELKDISSVDENAVKSAGAKGVIKTGKNSVQIVVGGNVQFVADAFRKLINE